MAVFQIPLNPSTNQQLQVTLINTTYTFLVRWNSYAGYWILDIYDETGLVPILRGTPLVTGADIFGQYQYLEFDGQFISITLAAGAPVDDVPTFENLGVDGQLYFVTGQTTTPVSAFQIDSGWLTTEDGVTLITDEAGNPLRAG